jgi:methionyl aminopeptidase
MNKIYLKTDEQISIMKEGGKVLSSVLVKLCQEAKVGTSLLELDNLAENLIKAEGCQSSFKFVADYKWSICASVNDVVVHGIPTEYKLKKGDVLGIDCGVLHKGMNTDSAWTVIVGNDNSLPFKNLKSGNFTEKEKFLYAGQQALSEAVSQVKEGNRIYDISKKIQENIENEGFSVVRTLVGHGVGKELHEAPEIPGFVKYSRVKTPEIIAGMVLAVEVIYNLGKPEIDYKGNDGWTIATKDGTISGLFEATVAVTSHGSCVLTPLMKGHLDERLGN